MIIKLISLLNSLNTHAMIYITYMMCILSFDIQTGRSVAINLINNTFMQKHKKIIEKIHVKCSGYLYRSLADIDDRFTKMRQFPYLKKQKLWMILFALLTIKSIASLTCSITNLARYPTDYWQLAYMFSLVYFSVEVCLEGVFSHSVSSRQDPCVRVHAPLMLASPSQKQTNRIEQG